MWLLLGFLLAGFVQEFLPIEHFLKYLGRNSPSSIAKMCLIGFATSMCTCGAIPLTITLRRKGATTANALTFLLSSPWTGFPL
ncbi:MAG: putative permease [Candidatus Bathyarchaeota archaeon BA1]|nr:MAG: putative permease [Candidatus Bathyarchaeota archaeon BA1]